MIYHILNKYNKIIRNNIKIYKPWKDNYELFQGYIEMNLGTRPSINHQLFLINEEGGYVPFNFDWVLPKNLTSNEEKHNLIVDIIEQKIMKGEPIRISEIGNKMGYNIYYQIKTRYPFLMEEIKDWNNSIISY